MAREETDLLADIRPTSTLSLLSTEGDLGELGPVIIRIKIMIKQRKDWPFY